MELLLLPVFNRVKVKAKSTASTSNLKQIYLASRISALALEYPNRLKVAELFEYYDPRTVGFTLEKLDEETGEKQATDCFRNRDNSDLDAMALKMLGLNSQLS